MAVISPNTFDPLKRYISVRLQQGVPIVDADWNELEDVRRFELRAYLKWFVGDGVPEGNDGFRAVGTGATNDFTLSAGLPSGLPPAPQLERGLRQVGRCLVDGLDVLLAADLAFRAQPLHVSQPGSAALAAAWGVPTVGELPVFNGSLLLYLDVWERLVTPSEDAGLVFPGLGTESCARLKREWVVRFRDSATVPSLSSPPDPDYLPGHGYYALARLTRRATSGAIQPGDVTDLRERRLLVPPATLIEDMLGTSPARYRQGLDRPPTSLRAALNALLRGDLPGTPERALTLTPGTDFIKRAFLVDSSQRLLAFWHTPMAGLDQVVGSRLDLSNAEAGFAPITQYTSGSVRNTEPHAVPLSDGRVLLVYQRTFGSGIFYKHLQPDLAPSAPEQEASPAGSDPFVVVSGDLAVFFFFIPTGNQWQYRRLRHTDATWIDSSPQTLIALTGTTTQRELHAARDTAGNIWVVVRSGVDLVPLRLSVADGAPTQLAPLDSGSIDTSPFVLASANGDVWVFWRSTTQGVMLARYSGGSLAETRRVPPSAEGDASPTAVEDAQGDLWLFFNRNAFNEIWFARRAPDGGWGQARLFTAGGTSNTLPHALVAPNRATWVFWTAGRGGASNIFYRQLFTTL